MRGGGGEERGRRGGKREGRSEVVEGVQEERH